MGINRELESFLVFPPQPDITHSKSWTKYLLSTLLTNINSLTRTVFAYSIISFDELERLE
jgi:hypothetical protein